MKKLLIIVSLILLTPLLNLATDEIEYEVLRDDLFSPWEIIEGPDNWLWYTERIGLVWKFNPETGEKVRLGQIDSVYNEWERGLMGMTFHPEFHEKPFVYLIYTARIGDYKFENRLVRFKYQNDTLLNYEHLLTIDGGVIHNGSRILFDPDGYLYVSTGEVDVPLKAQNNNLIVGKILRMNDEAEPVKSNPFYDNENKAKSYIYSYGHRNPQGLIFAGDRLFNTEHGPSTDDEFNEVLKGANYAWPKVFGFCDEDFELSWCEENDFEEPIKAWSPTVAVSGLDFYGGDKYKGWKNSFLIATLKDNTLHRLKMDDKLTEVVYTNEYFRRKFGRIRDIAVTNDGIVYIVSSENDYYLSPETKRTDKIIKIKPNINVAEKGDNIIEVHSNPVDNFVTLKTKMIISSVKIYNMLGQKVYEEDQIHSIQQNIQLNNIRSGAYTIVVRFEHSGVASRNVFLQ